MNKILAGLLAGIALAGAPGMALAETAVAQAPAVTRVVIAPPRTELAHIIKAALAAQYAAAPRDSRAYQDAQKLYYFYGERHFEPLWLAEQGGKVAFSSNAEAIIKLFKASEAEGFRPSDYLTPALDVAAAGSDPAKLAALETAFSDSALRYAQDLYAGRIRPSAVSSLITVPAKRIDASATLVKLAESKDPAKVLADLEPKHPEFLALKAALAKFSEDGVDQQIAIADGPLLKPGMSDERVPDLRKRLAVTAADPTSLVYDDDLVDAIKAFQDSLGLTADGVTGPATVAALNGGSATSKEDIIANMERWRWMPDALGDFHVFVNIPEFRLAINKDGAEQYTTRVVVGTVKNQTPVFSDMIRHVVVNPYWNVPSSIARNEIGPRLASNPGYLASQNMELLYGGKVVNAAAVDWSTTSVNNFSIRQKPGAGNALGQVKFLFPNQHDVYLHDTPSKSLFARSFRAYSHGCVRVQNPMDFADALLKHEPGMDAQALEAMFGPKERWVNLKTQVPVHLAYFTLRIDQDGNIRSYGDVYGHNKKLKELLAK